MSRTDATTKLFNDARFVAVMLELEKSLNAQQQFNKEQIEKQLQVILRDEKDAEKKDRERILAHNAKMQETAPVEKSSSMTAKEIKISAIVVSLEKFHTAIAQARATAITAVQAKFAGNQTKIQQATAAVNHTISPAILQTAAQLQAARQSSAPDNTASAALPETHEAMHEELNSARDAYHAAASHDDDHDAELTITELLIQYAAIYRLANFAHQMGFDSVFAREVSLTIRQSGALGSFVTQTAETFLMVSTTVTLTLNMRLSENPYATFTPPVSAREPSRVEELSDADFRQQQQEVSRNSRG